MSKIVPSKQIVQTLLEACVLTNNLSPSEIADFVDHLYSWPEFDQWRIIEVSPAKLIGLLKIKHVFDGWTAADNEISGKYASLPTDPPPVVLFTLAPDTSVVRDGRHRLVSRKHAPSITVAVPVDQADDLMRLVDTVRT